MTHFFSDIKQSIFPDGNYLESRLGNLPLLLCAPHGGGARPINIPSRTNGKLLRDTYTRPIIQELVTSYPKDFRPYYIYSNIHRSKVDLNRDREEGCQGNPKACEIWENWNLTIHSYLAEMLDKFDKVLLVDLHSHNNNSQFQLGYDVTRRDFLSLLAGREITGRSSLYGMGKNQSEVLFGEGSFYESLREWFYDIYIPLTSGEYFSGGWNTRRYTSDRVGTIQVEIPVSECKEDTERVCHALKYSIYRFTENYLMK